MKFRQPILKDEWNKFIAMCICLLPALLFLCVLAFREKTYAGIIIVLFVLPTLCLIPLYLIHMEWIEVYDDKIVCKCIYGTKNAVSLDKVLSVEKRKIRLVSHGCGKEFFLFNDGRKNNSNILDYTDCYNRSKYNFKIPVTDTLEAFLRNKQLID